MCFYTGYITENSNRKVLGVPEGNPEDDLPSHYFGLKILSAIQREFSDLPVIILSSKPRQEVSREFSQLGALAFLPRADVKSPELFRQYLFQHGLLQDESGEIVGSSKSLLVSLRAARRASYDRRNILVKGERGTGKELLAKYIHRQSLKMMQRPYIVVDSGTLSPQLYASELFGYKRGAFTGAEREKVGKIIQADTGDLFLDEIANIPPDVQSGLLRVLEYREVLPIGATKALSVNVRFLSATNENLDIKAQRGEFRPDLLDRLREGGTINLPPLRERIEDLSLLVEKLVRDAEQIRIGALKRDIHWEALEKVRNYDWNGNIRELKSCIFNAVFNFPDVEHLVPFHLQIGTDEAAKNYSVTGVLPSSNTALEYSTQINLDELIKIIETFEINDFAPDIVGRLPLLERASAHLIAKLIKSALLATQKPTNDRPEGEIHIHPAIKLITGDKSITASKAADIIKRLLKFNKEVNDLISTDPLLNEAYSVASRLRPKQSTNNKKSS